MRTPKFNFVPERQLKEATPDTKFRVSIYSNGAIVFPKDAVNIYDLNGKYIRLYVDKEKRSIGWSLLNGSIEIRRFVEGGKAQLYL